MQYILSTASHMQVMCDDAWNGYYDAQGVHLLARIRAPGKGDFGVEVTRLLRQQVRRLDIR